MSELTPQCSPAATGTKSGVLGCFDNDAIGRIQAGIGGKRGASEADMRKFIRERMMSECKNGGERGERGGSGGGTEGVAGCTIERAASAGKVKVEDQQRPLAPTSWRGKKPWLSTSEIGNVLDQYMDKQPRFLFIGPSPIDWYLKNGSKCVVSELCAIKWSELRAKQDWLGMVFNLDEHTEPGSHWVAAMVDVRGRKFYYQDSQGQPPEIEIKRLYCELGDQMSERERSDFKLYWNSNRHQQKYSECGVFSIWFIETLLEGGSGNTLRRFQWLCNNAPSDDEVWKLRGKQFNMVKA